MAVKLLISAETNSGKTTLVKPLKDTLVIAHDGKKFPFEIPHVNVNDFSNVDNFIDLINETIVSYKERFGDYPKTIVFDSVSKIFDTIADNCNNKYSGYDIHTGVNTEVCKFAHYLEDTIAASEINLVLISHAIYDPDNSRYKLIATGSFARRGAFLAEVNDSIFIEIKGSKRIIHFRSTKFPARTLQEDLPNTVSVEKFNLNDHIEMLSTRVSGVNEYEFKSDST